MTHERDDERDEHTAGQDWEVLSGPGGPEPERTAGRSLRSRWERQSLRARAVTAGVTVAVLALGGTVAYATTSGNSTTDGVPAASASSPTPPSADAPGDRHGPGKWFGMGGGGVHGEATVKDEDGDWVVRTWQWGTVEKVDGDKVTVKSDDGAEWTWTVGSDAKVYREGTSGSGADTLKKGDTAYLVGTRSEDGTRTVSHAVSGSRDDEKSDNWRDWLPGRGPWGEHPRMGDGGEDT